MCDRGVLGVILSMDDLLSSLLPANRECECHRVQARQDFLDFLKAEEGRLRGSITDVHDHGSSPQVPHFGRSIGLGVRLRGWLFYASGCTADFGFAGALHKHD